MVFHMHSLVFITPLQLESNVALAAAVVEITSNASTLESSAITVTANIINDLTDAAIEEPLVTCII